MKTFKNKKHFERFLWEIDAMPQSEVEAIMGENYIDTPGFYKDERKNYNGVEDFMTQNMGQSEFDRLKKYWETNVKK